MNSHGQGRCQVPKATVYKWRATGEGPPGMRLAKWPRFLESDIMAWLETRRDSIVKNGGKQGVA